MSRRVDRAFAFVDLCGFTAFMDHHGDAEAVRVLAGLRSAARSAAERHGVRVDKWLGDGLMLVGMDVDRVVACTVDIQREVALDQPLALRAGVGSGRVLLFEGDDYIGPAVNIASRLCAAARPWELLVATAAEMTSIDSEPRRINVRGLAVPVAVRSIDAQADRSRSGLVQEPGAICAPSRRRARPARETLTGEGPTLPLSS